MSSWDDDPLSIKSQSMSTRSLAASIGCRGPILTRNPHREKLYEEEQIKCAPFSMSYFVYLPTNAFPFCVVGFFLILSVTLYAKKRFFIPLIAKPHGSLSYAY